MRRLCLLFGVVLGHALGQTGAAVPSLAPFEQLVTGLMSKYGIPGGSIAVTQNGRLVLARGYGYADREAREPVLPDSRFRIASMSKFITGVTIMHLAEQGKFDLDQPAFALLPDLQAPAGATEDPRLARVTIRYLLTHSGGWDNTVTPDPLFMATTIASVLGVPSPASTENIIRYVRGQPLQFDPGTRFAYCNLGFAVLARIVERVTGMSYEQYVRTNVLAPMGITEMRIGQTLAEGRRPGEVKYYGDGSTFSVLPFASGPVSWPYGGWQQEGTDGAGGWVTSAIDYAKFVNAIDGRRGKRFLSAESVAAMTARPAIPEWAATTFWYAFGVEVHPSRGDADWDHSGSVDGTTTQFFRTSDGLVLVVFFNYRPTTFTQQHALGAELSIGLIDAAGRVANWPQGDSFPNYPDQDPVVAASQPALTTREGVANGATFDRGIVSGSWITIGGANLASATRSWSAAEIAGGVLPTELDGVSVRIAGKPAYISFVSPTQINAQAPAALTPGWTPVEVFRDGAGSGAVLSLVLPNAPGAFTYSSGGRTFAVATSTDGTLLRDRAAAPGETIAIYATGLAPSSAGTAIPEPLNVTGVEVTIGGQSALVISSALISPGLFQINAIVPNVEVGIQPLVLRIGGATSPPAVMLPIRR
jgi:N-acyl-D-amino-acid deacylase